MVDCFVFRCFRQCHLHPIPLCGGGHGAVHQGCHLWQRGRGGLEAGSESYDLGDPREKVHRVLTKREEVTVSREYEENLETSAITHVIVQVSASPLYD